jgi:hypothetical protein
MMSAVAAKKPAPSALPLPMPSCGTTLMSGRQLRAAIRVASVEFRSTRTISLTSSAICSSAQAMYRASILTGVTKLTVRLGFAEAGRFRLRRELATSGGGSQTWTVRFASCVADDLSPYPLVPFVAGILAIA